VGRVAPGRRLQRPELLVHEEPLGRDPAHAQIEDAGPYVYDDEAYVFGSNDARPASQQASNAGLDVSPAVRDYLRFGGTDAEDQLNNDENKVNWRFVNADQVPAGPWTLVVTAQQVYQR
jgi:hypothetical protein